MVERLYNYEGEVIKRSFRNKMRKEVSLKLHNIASKFSFRLEVKLWSSGRRTNETQKQLVLYFCCLLRLTFRDMLQNKQRKPPFGIRKMAEVNNSQRKLKQIDRNK
jgi:hypothetical protein